MTQNQMPNTNEELWNGTRRERTEIEEDLTLVCYYLFYKDLLTLYELASRMIAVRSAAR